jgi:hypothetical protein
MIATNRGSDIISFLFDLDCSAAIIWSFQPFILSGSWSLVVNNRKRWIWHSEWIRIESTDAHFHGLKGSELWCQSWLCFQQIIWIEAEHFRLLEIICQVLWAMCHSFEQIKFALDLALQEPETFNFDMMDSSWLINVVLQQLIEIIALDVLKPANYWKMSCLS